MASETESDLQQYLAKHQVESLFKEIVVQLCLHKPADPLSFINAYIADLQVCC